MSRKWLWLAAVVLVGAIVLAAVYPALAKGVGKGQDRVLSKATFIHFKKGHGKPPWAGGGQGGGKKDEGHYSYISKGAKWKEVEDFLLNPTCGENPKHNFVEDAVAAGMDEWETPEDAVLVIFGGLVPNTSVTYDDGDYRGYNTISFESLGDPWVIAVATVWGFFSGPPPMREIVEAHVLLNDDCVWGDADPDGDGEPDVYVMDVQNIVTHELGHCAGMGDVYEPAAGEETMYGYSEEGEVKKRDLYTGDVTGITKLYQ